MPNHVTTKLTIKSEFAYEIQAFRLHHLATDDERNRMLNFNSIIPMPEVLKSTNASNNGTSEAQRAVEQTGYPNWYDWRIDKWGTKWNSYHFSEDPPLPGDQIYRCSFDTAWSYPQPIFEKLHEMYPGLEMEVAFFDEGFIFAGHGAAHNPTYCEATDELHKEVYGVLPEREPEEELDPELQIDALPITGIEEEPEPEME